MFSKFPFRPKLLEVFNGGYSRQDFLRDLTAGVTVGIVALPLAMAFGIASGVDPRAGIYTAIVAGFIISVLGGSRVQIGGPTGAFVAIVYGVIAQYGLNNLILCTIMAGVILLIMGLVRMGTMIKYIPHPVTTGFTCGIAVLIFSTQIKDFFGLHIEKLPADFVGKFIEVGKAFAHEGAKAFSWQTLAM
ncbi:MAG: SulP family inorganic anion transporter, partial [Limisphaerales bacterium]